MRRGAGGRGRVLVAACLTAASALVLVTALIAEIAATPTADPGVQSDFWTPATSITALFFGHDAYTGGFEPLSILFGWLVIAAVSVLAGCIGLALLVYCLGWRPHPFAAALFGAAWGLATEIVVVNLLCNWLQSENGIYESLPSWGWWVGMGIWGAALGLSLAAAGRRLPEREHLVGSPHLGAAERPGPHPAVALHGRRSG